MVFVVNKSGVRKAVDGMRGQGYTDAEIKEYAEGIAQTEPEISAVMRDYLEEAKPIAGLQETHG